MTTDVHPSSSADNGTPLADLGTSLTTRYHDLGFTPTVNDIIWHVTDAYLDTLDPDDDHDPITVTNQLVSLVNSAIRAANTHASSSADKLTLFHRPIPWQLAHVLVKLHRVIQITPENRAEDADESHNLLSIYRATGPKAGLYVTNEIALRATARQYDLKMDDRDFNEVVNVLREEAPVRTQSAHRDLVPVNNGVFNYSAEPLDLDLGGEHFHFEPKSLHPFDPHFVLLSKSRVDYVENPDPVVITHPTDGDWEITVWMENLFDRDEDTGLADLMWEIIGATLRPYVNWDKAAWFYGSAGNNAKGTICALMRNILGPGAHVSISLNQMGKEFGLESLLQGAHAIIVDENEVGTLIDRAANLKAIVTHDVVTIERKHKTSFIYQAYGFMVQCVNDFPSAKDKTDSFYRRQLFVPFTKSFTGRERRYIKQDYLQRREVLEYALWYALNKAGHDTPGCYYSFSEPPATIDTLDEYKRANDPVRAFWSEMRGELVWDLLPFPFLHDLYLAWFTDELPSGRPVGSQQFATRLLGIIENDPDWYSLGRKWGVRPKTLMDAPEPLIVEYDLRKWKNPDYTGRDVDCIAKPRLAASYRGLLRRSPGAGPAAPAPADPADPTGDTGDAPAA